MSYRHGHTTGTKRQRIAYQPAWAIAEQAAILAQLEAQQGAVYSLSVNGTPYCTGATLSEAVAMVNAVGENALVCVRLDTARGVV